MPVTAKVIKAKPANDALDAFDTLTLEASRAMLLTDLLHYVGGSEHPGMSLKDVGDGIAELADVIGEKVERMKDLAEQIYDSKTGRAANADRDGAR